jgi:hypothetical protein
MAGALCWQVIMSLQGNDQVGQGTREMDSGANQQSHLRMGILKFIEAV